MKSVILMLALAGVVFTVRDSAAAQRAKSPAEATVFIRLVGSLHVEVEFGVKKTADRDHVEIGTLILARKNSRFC
jgi:hypothetical protein